LAFVRLLEDGPHVAIGEFTIGDHNVRSARRSRSVRAGI
jgi:hypothetical protein